MNILIPHVPHSSRHDVGMSQGFSNANFPLGLAYVLAAIRKSFPEVKFYSAPFDLLQVETKEEIDSEFKEISRKFKPDFILFSSMITRYDYVVTLSRCAKKFFPAAKQVLGGGASTWGHYLFLGEAPIDYFTIGEAEETIISILSGKVLNVPGIYDSMELAFNAPVQKQVLPDLNSLPFPSHADFAMDQYIEIQRRITGWRTVPMVASRGCPFNCKFCSPSTHSLRMRDVDNVIEEMKFLKTEYGADSIYFWDELQFVKKPWFEELCHKLIAQKLKLSWVFVTRATLIRERDIQLLRLAKKAGCLRVSIGIESGSEIILEAMNKKTSIEDMENALRYVRKAGIKATGSMLLGFPGESKETVQTSIDFANRNLLETSFYSLIPLPGAPVYDDYSINNDLIGDEKKYMYKISREGGDASNIMMNLTDMNDETYISETARANQSVRNFGFRSAIEYYGAFEGSVFVMGRKVARVHNKLNNRLFDTP